MSNWIHRLFNPHCTECGEQTAEARICQSCETLKMQLAIANAEKKQLLDSILLSNYKEVEEPTRVDYETLKPKMTTWSMRKQMLEAEDRKTAQLIAEKAKIVTQINKLEKEVGIDTEVKADV